MLSIRCLQQYRLKIIMEVRTPGRNQPLLLCFSADECDLGARGETGLVGDPSTDSGGKLGAN